MEAPPIIPTPTFGNAQGLANFPIATDSVAEDIGSGRTALAMEANWARRVLENFTERYPLTGNLKGAPQASINGRHAAVIQQKLEFLLFQEKEKKASESLFSKQIQHSYR